MPVEIIRRDDGKEFSSRKLKKVAQKVLEIVEQDKAELCLVLVGNAEIRKLNAKFRKKDYPTDVLSFTVGDELPTGVQLLGDVVVSVEKAKEQAKERRRPLNEERCSDARRASEEGSARISPLTRPRKSF